MNREVEITIKERLVALGPDKLAELLLNLSKSISGVENAINILLASRQDKIKQFKSRILNLKKDKRYYNWNEVSVLEAKVKALMLDLKEAADSPETGIDFTRSVIELDSTLFEKCDDSSGYLGMLFDEIFDLFIEYATGFEDKEKLIKIITELYSEDDYGVRGHLIDCVIHCLPEARIRALVEIFWKKANIEKNEYSRSHWIIGIESLAKQLTDPELFLKAVTFKKDKIPVHSHTEISQIYFNAGKYEEALNWLKKIPENESFHEYEREKLLLEIYKKQNNLTKLAEIRWKRFNKFKSLQNLNDLLETIGEENREKILKSEIERITNAEKYSEQDIQFLIEIEKVSVASSLILKFRDSLNGDFYSQLLEFAKTMEQHGYWFSATCLYRALLESILKRAKSKYYHHGVKYLSKCDYLSLKIKSWDGLAPHDDFKIELAKKHSRKTSFWEKYEEIAGNQIIGS